MCGRYSLHHRSELIVKRFDVQSVLFEHEPRYNIAPGQSIPVILSREGNTLFGFKWGLVPGWANDPSIGNRMINARAETMTQRASFREGLERRRCLIPADGFFEWRKLPSGRQPVFIRRKDGDMFAFAGLWEQWIAPHGESLWTTSIITVKPNRLVGEIHNRMPAMLSREDERLWLDKTCRRATDLLKLLSPYEDDLLEAHEVSRSVNRVENDSPELIIPLKSDRLF
jgi:putative SOS response-associated peptidase YedK